MFLIKDYNSNYKPIKLVLSCGLQTSNNLLINFLIETYNFLNYKDFFDEFSKLTSIFSSYNLLVRVLLFIPDSMSNDTNYYFYIKSFSSSFFIKNFLLNNYKLFEIKNKINNIEIRLELIILIKICLILLFFNYSSEIFNIKILNLKNFNKFFKSFLNSFLSFQFFFFINNNMILFSKKYVNIKIL